MPSETAMVAAITLSLAAMFTDIRTRRIPNALVLAGAAFGMGLAFWARGTQGGVEGALGALAGLAVFMPFFLLGGMGAGDVKLMGALGTCLGASGILQVALVTAFAGAVLAMATAAAHGVFIATLARTGTLMKSWLTRGPRPSRELSLDNPESLKIPYAVPIAAGVVFNFFQGI